MKTAPKEHNEITRIIMDAAAKARAETDNEPEPAVTKKSKWPVECTVGPGLEGAIACESKVGYVNGTKGWLIYRGYDIFDLCAHSTFEEVSYLLLHGDLPSVRQLQRFNQAMIRYRYAPNTLRQMMSLPIEQYNTMAALRLGVLFLRRQTTYLDRDVELGTPPNLIDSDEDSIPMETQPQGEEHAIYEFAQRLRGRGRKVDGELGSGADFDASYRLISASGTLAAGVARLRAGQLPISPNPELSHAANLLYMMTGREPTPTEERIMDVALILHADHGMNASTFAALVVASTLSDVFFSVGAGIAALNGPLHGGANAEVLSELQEIGAPRKVRRWYSKARAQKRKVMGFGHRVYKAYDPRARILGPLAAYLADRSDNPAVKNLFDTANALEDQVITTLGVEKKIFPNVDFYSGIVYTALGVPQDMFTPLFAVSRVSGWTARVLEYLKDNRIFRPRAIYTGPFDKDYVPLEKRD